LKKKFENRSTFALWAIKYGVVFMKHGVHRLDIECRCRAKTPLGASTVHKAHCANRPWHNRCQNFECQGQL